MNRPNSSNLRIRLKEDRSPHPGREFQHERLLRSPPPLLLTFVTTSKTDIPVALTVATSDSGGGAGIQADLKTFASRGVYGTSVFCALTAQNPNEVLAIAELTEDFIQAQLNAIFRYYKVGAIKTGMLFSAKNIELVANYLRAHPTIPYVLDPVMVATSGAILLQPDAIDALKNRLLPAATLITPNLDEAAVLLGEHPKNPAEMEQAAKNLHEAFHTAVLLKGGHLESAGTLIDVLYTAEGPRHFSHQRIDRINTHGSGCTLAAAITAELAKGQPLVEAVGSALEYLHATLEHPVYLNREGFIRH